MIILGIFRIPYAILIGVVIALTALIPIVGAFIGCVVGGSIGLPSMWVLVAVSVGGSLFGITRILLFIPLCSVCYALFRDFIHERLRKRAVAKEKYEIQDS